MHSEQFGDVLVGITHGSGRVPQVGKVWKWIQQTLAEKSTDSILWVTPQQLF